VQKEGTVGEPDDGHAAGEVAEGNRKLERALGDPQTRGESSERRIVCVSNRRSHKFRFLLFFFRREGGAVIGMPRNDLELPEEARESNR
jgi:hypothetical protein